MTLAGATAAKNLKNAMANKKIMTLCIVHQHPKILLGMKKRGFGGGRWNGFGGKVKEGETIEDALKREMVEECSIVPEDIKKLGIIDFHWKNKEDVCEVHIYKINKFSGIPTESEEMKPEWFDVDKIPFGKMWSDDPFWMPLFLAGKKFKGKFLFDDSDNILEKELAEVTEI